MNFRWLRWKSQMFQDFFDDRRFFDSGDDSHVAVAFWAVTDVNVKDAL